MSFNAQPIKKMPTQSVEALRYHIAENPLNRITLAIDHHDVTDLMTIDRRVIEAVGAVKIGNELHNVLGWPSSTSHFNKRGARGIYFDARFSETPSSMAKQMKWFNDTNRSVPVTSGIISVDAIQVADEALREAVRHKGDFMLITESVQPSLTDEDCIKRNRRSSSEVVMDIAHIAVETGLQGITSSAFELGCVADEVALGSLVRIASGIRVEGDCFGDQIRVASPGDAIRMGAEVLVIGQSILKAPGGDQYGRLMQIAEEIDAAA